MVKKNKEGISEMEFNFVIKQFSVFNKQLDMIFLLG